MFSLFLKKINLPILLNKESRGCPQADDAQMNHRYMVTTGINIHPVRSIQEKQGDSGYGNERQCDELAQQALVYRRNELSKVTTTMMMYALCTRLF